MKRYNSVFELEAELIQQGFVKDKNITIPANGDPDESWLHDQHGNSLCAYPKYKAYYIHPAKVN